jgi:hypothetical protein
VNRLLADWAPKALLANGLARPIARGLPFGVKFKNSKAPATKAAGFGSSRSRGKARLPYSPRQLLAKIRQYLPK